MSTPATFLAGTRLPFAASPAPVRAWVADLVGGVVVSVRDAAGGMSQGFAAVVDGRSGRVFVKGVGRTTNPVAFDMLVDEARRTALLPSHPSLPRVVAADVLDVDGDRWALLALTAVEGVTPGHPWSGADAERVLDAWAEVAPVVQGLATDDLPPSDVPDFLGRWPRIAEDPEDPWHTRARRWSAPCSRLATSTTGGALPVAAHVDLRADNVVVDSTVVFVDWAHLSTAAPWVDSLLLMVDVAGSGADTTAGGGLDVMDLWRHHPATHGLDDDLLVTGAAALAGALHLTAARPVPGLPHRTTWARAMADGLMAFVEAH